MQKSGTVMPVLSTQCYIHIFAMTDIASTRGCRENGCLGCQQLRHSTAGNNALQMSLELLGLYKPAFDPGALVSIHLSHLVSYFGAVVKPACLLVPVPVQGLLSGLRVTCRCTQPTESLPDVQVLNKAQRKPAHNT